MLTEHFDFALFRFSHRIIRIRQQQRNFQLIVITQDEEFVQNLGRADFVDYYFRIYKDDRYFMHRSVFELLDDTSKRVGNIPISFTGI